MINLIAEYGVSVLSENDEAIRLADIYVAEKVVPEKYYTDGLHIALATVNGPDNIVSMNFEHIVKEKTIKMTECVNIQSGHCAIGIFSPEEVMKDENGDPPDRAGSK